MVNDYQLQLRSWEDTNNNHAMIWEEKKREYAREYEERLQRLSSELERLTRILQTKDEQINAFEGKIHELSTGKSSKFDELNARLA